MTKLEHSLSLIQVWGAGGGGGDSVSHCLDLSVLGMTPLPQLHPEVESCESDSGTPLSFDQARTLTYTETVTVNVSTCLS